VGHRDDNVTATVAKGREEPDVSGDERPENVGLALEYWRQNPSDFVRQYEKDNTRTGPSFSGIEIDSQ